MVVKIGVRICKTYLTKILQKEKQYSIIFSQSLLITIKYHMIKVHKTKPEKLVVKKLEIYKKEDRNWVKCRIGIRSL